MATPIESRDDVWSTGLLLVPSAASLPRGHVLAQPHLYDVRSQGSDAFASLSYFPIGIADEVTAGVVPTADSRVVRQDR